jgi:hypothetical protein
MSLASNQRLAATNGDHYVIRPSLSTATGRCGPSCGCHSQEKIDLLAMDILQLQIMSNCGPTREVRAHAKTRLDLLRRNAQNVLKSAEQEEEKEDIVDEAKRKRNRARRERRKAKASQLQQSIQTTRGNPCAICYETDVQLAAVVDCGHTFCVDCIQKLGKCALCNCSISKYIKIFLN